MSCRLGHTCNGVESTFHTSISNGTPSWSKLSSADTSTPSVSRNSHPDGVLPSRRPGSKGANLRLPMSPSLMGSTWIELTSIETPAESAKNMTNGISCARRSLITPNARVKGTIIGTIIVPLERLVRLTIPERGREGNRSSIARQTSEARRVTRETSCKYLRSKATGPVLPLARMCGIAGELAATVDNTDARQSGEVAD